MGVEALAAYKGETVKDFNTEFSNCQLLMVIKDLKGNERAKGK